MADTAKLPQAEVVERIDLTPDLMIMKLKPCFDFLAFKPGQYCTLGLDGEERAYSIVSSPHEAYLEFFLELVPEKYRLPTSLTPRLWKLKIGQTVSLRPRAKGVFLLDEKRENHVMIATVTGIAPFISMLRSHLLTGYYRRGFRKILVLQGASYLNEFGYESELRQMAFGGKISYLPTISRPNEMLNAAWNGAQGRVNLIAENCMARHGIKPEETTVYLCGNEKMIEDLGNKKPAPDKPLGKLIAAGFRVKEEIYF